MTLLLTRPEEDSKQLRITLSEQGYDCIISPALHIEPTGAKVASNASFDAVIATSRHALMQQPVINAPLYVVGKSTARRALDLGWSTPVSVAATSQHLIDTLKFPKGASILYLRGADVSANLPAALPQYDWQEVITYRATPLPLTEAAMHALRHGEIDGVLFFSKRTAQFFEKACEGLTIKPVRAVCLSKGIANALRLSCWSEKRVADVPTEAALIDALGKSGIVHALPHESPKH